MKRAIEVFLVIVLISMTIASTALVRHQRALLEKVVVDFETCVGALEKQVDWNKSIVNNYFVVPKEWRTP